MPILQVGVKALLINGNGKFLVLRRSEEKYSDVATLWDIAGGRIDIGEDLEGNLQREVSEETGLRLAGDPVLAAAQDIMPNSEMHVVRLTYVAQVLDGTVRLSEEHTSYRWVTYSELMNLEGLCHHFREVLDDVRDVIENKFSGGGYGGDDGFTSNMDGANGGEKTDNKMLQKRENTSKNKEIIDEIFVKLGEEKSEVGGENKGDKKGGGEGTGERKGGGESKKTLNVGRLGEDIATKYLKDRGFHIVGRNYRKKWGEIDVIAEKEGALHFVEVKTVSRENYGRTAGGKDGYRPEENVHPKKLERLHRTIQSYLAEKDREDGEWQLDVLAIELSQGKKEAKCRFLENIV